MTTFMRLICLVMIYVSHTYLYIEAKMVEAYLDVCSAPDRYSIWDAVINFSFMLKVNMFMRM